MGTAEGQPGQEETKPEIRRYLTAAEYFLRHRDFDNCRKYALRAAESDPTHPVPTLILPIVSVLSAPNISSTRPDYYDIFNLRHFEHDAARIESSFKSLASNLKSKVNPYPFSSEAFDVVLQAWAVLSDPIEKARFDDELRRSLGGCTSGSDGGTFWTMCPYCYYVYEYDRGFEDCSLRCANERCRRVLHAVAIGAPPPPEVVEKGYYWCAGFMPLTICNVNGEENGENLWAPFASSVGSSSKERDHIFNYNGRGLVLNIFDDENAEEMGVHGYGNDKKAKIEGKASDSGKSNGVRQGSDSGFMDNCVNGNEGGDWEGGFGCETSNNIESGVKFFEGDDDVFVGLHCDLDLRNEDLLSL